MFILYVRMLMMFSSSVVLLCFLFIMFSDTLESNWHCFTTWFYTLNTQITNIHTHAHAHRHTLTHTNIQTILLAAMTGSVFDVCPGRWTDGNLCKQTRFDKTQYPRNWHPYWTRWYRPSVNVQTCGGRVADWGFSKSDFHGRRLDFVSCHGPSWTCPTITFVKCISCLNLTLLEP